MILINTYEHTTSSSQITIFFIFHLSLLAADSSSPHIIYLNPITTSAITSTNPTPLVAARIRSCARIVGLSAVVNCLILRVLLISRSQVHVLSCSGEHLIPRTSSLDWACAVSIIENILVMIDSSNKYNTLV